MHGHDVNLMRPNWGPSLYYLDVNRYIKYRDYWYLPDGVLIEDASIYHKKLKVLRQQLKWRDMIDDSFEERYGSVKSYVMESKYRLGTQYLRQVVEKSFDKYTRYDWASNLEIKSWFEAPANAEGIVEMVEAFTYDGGNLMKDLMEERKYVVRTYEK